MSSSHEWPNTWPRKALMAAGIPVTPFTTRALILWHKSTPIDPWSMNPLGIPAKGYTRRTVPGTEYALFNSYAEFSRAFTKAMNSERGGAIKLVLTSGNNTLKLWREINALTWPANGTENDHPREIHTWMIEQHGEKLGVKQRTPHRSSGTTSASQRNNRLVMDAHRAMIEATQANMKLSDAILHIVKRVN